MTHTTVYDHIAQTTFNTPLVRLNRLVPRTSATVLLKLEFFNPLSSVKDRIGRAMVEAAEHARLLDKDTHIIEPTSGNTGIALAFIAAAKGYRLTLVMPRSMSRERRVLLKALGAELVLTPAQEGMRGAIARAQELAARSSNVWMPQQFENPSNPAIHETTTGPEIWAATGGNVDVFVAGVGTGGTLTGVTRFLRRRRGIQAVAVEPTNSPVIAGGRPGVHRIQGIGPGFIPRNLDTSLLDGVEQVTDEEAFAWARRLAAEEGILAGISSGANVAAAVRLAARPENRGKTIVTVAASSGERYLSTALFSPSRRRPEDPGVDATHAPPCPAVIAPDSELALTANFGAFV